MKDPTVLYIFKRDGDQCSALLQKIADQMEEWLLTDACDGFNVMFPFFRAGLDDFVDRVVPELQRRGIFRREYEGITLRENLGLPRPENRFFPSRAKHVDSSTGLGSTTH